MAEDGDAKLITALFTKLQELIQNGQGVSKKAVRVIEDSEYRAELKCTCSTSILKLNSDPPLPRLAPLMNTCLR